MIDNSSTNWAEDILCESIKKIYRLADLELRADEDTIMREIKHARDVDEICNLVDKLKDVRCQRDLLKQCFNNCWVDRKALELIQRACHRPLRTASESGSIRPSKWEEPPIEEDQEL